MQYDEIERNLTNHQPTDEQQMAIDAIRKHAKNLGMVIGALPETREKALALTKLEECVMWANACAVRY